MGNTSDFAEWLRYQMVIFAYLVLLAFYLIILGIALAGLVTAMRRKQAEAANAPWNRPNDS